VLRQTTSDQWIARCRTQIAEVITVLDADRADRATPYWFGAAIGHADIAVACALRFTREAHPDLFDDHRWSNLAAHSTQCENLAEFRAISQPFLPPN
jgi:glutathione S-transferase